jgi:hypothetical protein
MKYLLILPLLAFIGCREDAQETIQNGNFQVEFLFEQDSCKMYRFKDGTRMIYWANCAGRTQYDYTTSTGKSTVTHHGETLTTE